MGCVSWLSNSLILKPFLVLKQVATHMKKSLKNAASNVKTHEKQWHSNTHIGPQTLLWLKLY